MQEQGITKRGNAIKKIIQRGLSALDQKRDMPDKSGIVTRPDLHAPPQVIVRRFTPNPTLTREVQRFMRGNDSPLIQGLFSIDELSIKHASIAGNESGLLFHIPATPHGNGAVDLGRG